MIILFNKCLYATVTGVCPLVKEATALGCVIHPVRLTRRQQEILEHLQFPTPAQILNQRLPHYPRK